MTKQTDKTNKVQRGYERSPFLESGYLDSPLPSAPDAERFALGGVLLDNKLAAELFAYLQPSDFYSPLHKKVAEAIQTVWRRGSVIDPITVGEEIRKKGQLETIGGIATITNFTYGIPHFSSIKEWCVLIEEKSVARQAIETCNILVMALINGEEENRPLISQAIRTLTRLLENKSKVGAATLKAVVKSVRETWEGWQKNEKAVAGLPTGIPELDGYLRTNGIALGELTLIAARPSTGKTALLLQIATHIIRLGTPALFISLEMLKEKLVMRMIPPLTSVSNTDINPRTFQSSPETAEELFAALDSIQDLPMFFERTFEISELIPTASHYIETLGVKLIAFDYLTLIKDTVQRTFNRDAEIGKIANELKELGIRTNTAILGAAQFNRDPEKEGRKPRPSDLRESGNIEQAADNLIFPFDEDAKYHDENPELIKDSMYLQLYCAKQRDGERFWSVPVMFDKNKQTFTSAEMNGGTLPALTGGSTVSDAPAVQTEAAPRDEDMPDF